MANITFKDIGRANLNGTGDQESLVANSGNPYTIKGVSISYNRSTSIDDSPNPGRYEDTETNITSFENAKLSISGTINTNESGDMDNIQILDDLVKSKGLKLLYYSSTTDGFETFTSVLGTVRATLLDATTKCLVVRCTSLSLNQRSNTSQVTYTIQCTVTNG